jgi:hypothetical protein
LSVCHKCAEWLHLTQIEATLSAGLAVPVTVYRRVTNMLRVFGFPADTFDGVICGKSSAP